MAKPKELSVGSHLVLGLLLDGPASGYELGRRAAQAIAYFWPMTRAHIYAELPKLEQRGYAVSEEVVQQGVPDKRVYTATNEGREQFRRWLASFDQVAERAHQPLQIQLHFAQHTSTEHLLAQLDSWEQEVWKVKDFCQNLLDNDIPVNGKMSPRGLTALFAVRRADTDLAWLAEARSTLL